MEKLNSTKKRVFISLVGPSEMENSRLIFVRLKIGTFQKKFDMICFFYQYLKSLYDCMLIETDNSEFLQGVNFEFIDSFKNNVKNYLLIFDSCCEGILNSKPFVDIATANRHRELSTNLSEHNLFHKSNFGRDVELQYMHIVLFKPPRDLMQVSASCTVGCRIRDGWLVSRRNVCTLRSVVDWLLPRTDDRWRYCSHTEFIPLKVLYPVPAETVKFFGHWTQKFFLLSKFSHVFLANARIFSFSLV